MPGTVSRTWWAAAAFAIVAFATYVSLVPFRFVRPPHGLVVADVWSRMLDNRGMSRSNIAANAVMFLPFGFFAAAACVDYRSRIWQWVCATAGVVAISVVVSVTIETLQMFVPGRTPSLADIEAQTIGTTLGIAAWFVLDREIATLSARFVSGSRRALESVLAVYAVIRFLLLVQPLDVSVELPDLARKFRTGGVVLNPLHSPTLRWDLLPSLLSDVFLGAPIGVLAAIVAVAPGKRRTAPSAILLGACFFLVGEAAQLFVRSRTVDIVDLAANVLGVVVGVALVVTLTGPGAATGDGRQSGRIVLTSALLASAFMYAAYNFSPFNFSFSRTLVASRAGMLMRVPFQGYYQNPEFKALADACLKMSLALPLGVFFQLRWRPDKTSFRRSLMLGWLVLTAVFFTAVEVGQVFLPSRYPDNSDVILAVVAVWLGVRLARPFSR